MKKPRQRSLRVRVDYEPNRFPDDCLEKIYAQLHPIKSREVTPVKSDETGESEAQNREEEQR